MKYKHRRLLELISSKLNEFNKRLSSSEITTVLKSFSILQHRSDFLFKLMVPEVSIRLGAMKPSEISSIFYSYTNLGYYNKNFYNTIQCNLYKSLNKMTPFDLTLILSGYSKIKKGFDDKFLTVLACQFCKLLDSYDDKSFSLSVIALSKLDFCNHIHIKSLIESEVYDRTRTNSKIHSLSIVLILSGLSRHHRSMPLFTHLSNIIAKRLKELDIHSLCLVSSSFGRLSYRNSDFFDKIADFVGKLSLNLYPRAIASLIYSYGQVKHINGPLLYYCSKHLELYTDQYSCDEIGMILHAFSILNVKNENVLSNIALFINKITPDYVPMDFIDTCSHVRFSKKFKIDSESMAKVVNASQSYVNETSLDVISSVDQSENYLANAKIHSILWIIQCYAKFFFLNDSVRKLLSKLSMELINRMDQLSPSIIGNSIHAYAELNYRHDLYLKMLINEIEDPRFIFNQRELALIHNSLTRFGFDANDCGIYQLTASSLKKLLDTYNTIELALKVISNDHDVEHESNLRDAIEEFRYIHIPRYVKNIISNDQRSLDSIPKQIKTHLDYNFVIK